MNTYKAASKAWHSYTHGLVRAHIPQRNARSVELTHALLGSLFHTDAHLRELWADYTDSLGMGRDVAFPFPCANCATESEPEPAENPTP